ncbi:MAG: N-acetylglutaminylglutamine amidotransferase, partial [Mycobacterium sp.]|nr:N-acetylglutaminylglutamine amidotransferase [Mycobacterium sp.]
LDLVTDTLRSSSAVDRGLYRPAALDRLFADPNGIRTTLDGNELWQVALLEMWLQSMEAITAR